MLHYLGPQIGSTGPVTNMLPPSAPGTMPSAVPGAGSPAPSLPQRPMHAAVNAGGSPPPPGILAAILRSAAPSAPSAGPPPPPEYATTTQADGSILLHIREPGGKLGPVVKVIPAIKRADSSDK